MSLSVDKAELKKYISTVTKKRPMKPIQELLFVRCAYLNNPKDLYAGYEYVSTLYKLKHYENAIQICDKLLADVRVSLPDQEYITNLHMTRAHSKYRLLKVNQLQEEFTKLKTYLTNLKPQDKEKLNSVINVLEKELPNVKDQIKLKSDQEKMDEVKRVKKLLDSYELARIPEAKVYLLSMQWFNRWKKFVSWQKYVQEEANENVNFMEEELPEEFFLPPPDQSDILEEIDNLIDYDEKEAYTNVGVKLGLQENKDFLIISPELWEYFTGLYGPAIPVPRYTIWRDENMMEVSIEIWLQQVNVYVLIQDTTSKAMKPTEIKSLDKVFISKRKTIKDLGDKLQRIYFDFLKSISAKHRIWKVDPRYEIKNLSSDITRSLSSSIISKIRIKGKILEETDKIEDSEISGEDAVVLEYRMYPNTWLLTSDEEEANQKKDAATTPSTAAINNINHNKGSKMELESDEMMKYFDISKKHFSSSSKKGLTGLQNLGNTCFMNSALQCMSNTWDLSEYFINNGFSKDLNPKNPIGTGGKLAVVYAELLKEMWMGSQAYVSPWDFKKVIGRVASQFMGYGQQDSQELLSYLLDGLHEDLNRVKVKPAVESIESNDRDDETVSQLSWENHLKRNQSKIQELMHGQYKSKLVCPDCGRVSITFDPYMMLSLPIPQIEYSKFFLYFISDNAKQLPAKVTFNLPKNTSANDIKSKLAEMVKVKENNIVMALLKEHKLVEMVSETADAYYLKEHSAIPFAYQIPLYDEDRMTNEQEKQFLVKCLISAEPKSFYESEKVISYTRLILVDTSVTFQELHLKVYEKMRHHVFNHFTKQGKKCNINVEDKSMKKIKEEYEELFPEDGENNVYRLHMTNLSKEDPKSGKKPVCVLCDKKCKSCVLPYEPKKLIDYATKMNVPVAEIVLDCKITKPTKIENLLLNQCQEQNTGGPADTETPNKEYNIYDCLKQFSRTETLEKENAWYCSKCKNHKQATKTLSIFKAPEVLIVHLKRFKTSKVSSFGSFYYASGSQKISAVVDFPVNGLDLTNSVLSKDSTSKVYDLYAVSNHYGGLGGGHYTAFCKNFFENRWYEFNDSRVSPTNEREVISAAAYVLFYKRRK
jgi:ubiquitin carboxyl-terminal hydrolase 4/11/15